MKPSLPTDKIKTCVIGCGAVAGSVDSTDTPYVLSHGKAISRHPAFELVGCYDIERNNALRFQTTWGGKKVYGSIDELCADTIDLYVICSSTASHYTVFEQLITSTCKGVICEKPIVATIAELQNFKKKIKDSEKKVVINFTRRFDAMHAEIRKFLGERPLGKLLHFNAHVGKGLLHNGSHFVDLLFYFFGDIQSIKPLSAYARDGDILGASLITLHDGTEGIVQTTAGAQYGLFLNEFVFEGGMVSLRGVEDESCIYKREPSSKYKGFNRLNIIKRLPSTMDQAFYNLYDLYAKDQIDYAKNLEDAVKGAELLFGVKEKVSASA